MLVKISYGNKATINTGNYENLNPMYNLSVEIEGKAISETKIKNELIRITDIVETHLAEYIENVKNPKAPLPHHRVEDIDGKKYPHVTTIISPELLSIPGVNLDAHGKAGTLFHDSMNDFIEDGLFTLQEGSGDPEIDKIYMECYLKMKDRLPLENVEFIKHSCPVRSEEHLYVGELDAVGTLNGIPTIFDFKKTKKITKQLLNKYFIQISAYAKATDGDIKQMVIVSPFNELFVETDIDGYFAKFLKLRQEYRNKYGI